MTDWQVVPHPKLKRDYIGRTVRTKRGMKNSMVSIPAGTIAVVKWRPRTGAELVSEPCKCCGLSAIMSKVQDCDIVFVEPAPPVQGPKQHGWPVGTRICDCVTGEPEPQPCRCELAAPSPS